MKISNRLKVGVCCGVLAVCTVWIALNMRAMMSQATPGKPLSSPGWDLANEVNVELSKNKLFHDASLAVTSESPLSFSITGGVRTEKDAKAIETAVRELLGEHTTYELSNDVVIIAN